MRHVPAREVPPALRPSGRLVRSALGKLQKHYDSSPGTGTPAAQRRPPIQTTLYLNADVREALAAEFSGKCAYCESRVDVAEASSVNHFRPTGNAIGSDGVHSWRHYWWLTYEWSNLLLSCPTCDRAKGRRFPVLGQRMEPGDPAGREQAMLIDPRDPRDFEPELLTFLRDGTVAGNHERAIATIDVLALNRSALVEARSRRAERLLAARRSLEPDSPELAAFTGAGAEFSAMCRQLLAVEDVASAGAVPDTGREEIKAQFDHVQQVKQSASAFDPFEMSSVPEQNKEAYFSGARWIERIEVHNVRPLRDLTLDCTRSTTSDRAAWLVLLGDNGTGKSSILQAVALTLCGIEARKDLGVTPEMLLNRDADEGYVHVWLSGLPDPVRLAFNRATPDFEGIESAPVLLLGYGPTRFAGTLAVAQQSGRPVRVGNLFDPRTATTDPTLWLAGLAEDQFDEVAGHLHAVLDLDDSVAIERDTGGEVLFRRGQQRNPLNVLSDGHRSMLTLACDVLSTLLQLWPTPDHAEGVVLIDELGTHLHPRWRMKVVGALRAALPRVQFVVSTHEPLCLRGLDDGEVAVLVANSDGEVVTLTDLPPVKNMRVDQLLTSEHFGLHSTVDPDLDALFTEYYELRGRRRPNRRATARLEELEAELERRQQLGSNERERMLLNAADQFIADRRQTGDRPDVDGRDPQVLAAEQRMVELWSATVTPPQVR